MAARAKPTKFQTSWQIGRKWLRPGRDSIYAAQCNICAKSLSVEEGKSAITQHEKTQGHKNKVLESLSFYCSVHKCASHLDELISCAE